MYIVGATISCGRAFVGGNCRILDPVSGEKNMRVSQKHPVSDAIHHEPIGAIQAAIVSATSSDAALAELDHAQAVMESFPLAWDEFAVAKNRIANARRYFTCDESGAAHYELQMLVRSLVQSAATSESLHRGKTRTFQQTEAVHR